MPHGGGVHIDADDSSLGARGKHDPAESHRFISADAAGLTNFLDRFGA
jgi:hypothetical protein